MIILFPIIPGLKPRTSKARLSTDEKGQTVIVLSGGETLDIVSWGKSRCKIFQHGPCVLDKLIKGGFLAE